MSDPYKPRRSAAEVLGRVIRHGAYSNVLLRQGLHELDEAEMARTRALVYGTIRALPGLDRLLQNGSTSPIEGFEPEILDILRVAAFEITSSDVPNPVAVSVGVDMVKERRPRAAGLANAILHRVAEAPSTTLTIELPGWLQHSLTRIWDEVELESFVAASAGEAARIGRLRRGSPGPARPVPLIAGAFEMAPGPIPENFVVQDAASIAVGNALSVERGMSVLDVAAAPGGKTFHLADSAGPDGLVVGADLHRRRLRGAARRVPEALWVRADATTPPFRSRSFDRVLLDAPCSGLGTLRRRPEIAYRVTEEGVAALAGLQKTMLEQAMKLVKPGGRLIYSVCTVTPEETIDVVAGMGTVAPPDTVGKDLGHGRLMAPHTTGTDGMFIAQWDN